METNLRKYSDNLRISAYGVILFGYTAGIRIAEVLRKDIEIVAVAP